MRTSPGAEPATGSRAEPRRRGGPWRELLADRRVAVGLVIVATLVAAALLAPFLAPFDPAEPVARAAGRLPPSWTHPMGTDRFGRDLLSRVLFGARVSLAVATLSVAIAVAVGTAAGAVAGYAGGGTDRLLMRGVDLLLGFPRIVLLVVAAALFGPSLLTVVLLLGITGWMGTARLVRGEVLSVREREYVMAARALGFGTPRILARHVIPNALHPVLVAAALGAGDAILAEAALSFLGLGVQPPTPSWGGMVAAGQRALPEAWWVVVFPGLAITLAVVGFNLLADGAARALRPGGGP